MRQIDLRLRLFLSEDDRERSERAMHFVLHALCCIDAEVLRAYPGLPPLYRSGVRYDTARAGKKEWQDALDTYSRRLGDCKDLACWRVAEWWTGPPRAPAKLRARPYIRYKMRSIGGRQVALYHVLVQLPGGQLEDPSRILGMGDEWEAMAGVGGRGEKNLPRRLDAGYSPAALAMLLFPP